MNSTITKLWRETGANSLIAIILFGALLGVLYVLELVVPELKNTLLSFNEAAFCVGIPASIIGVAYILSIKNPANYTGFYLGVASSALLGAQFYLKGLYDLTFLYFVVFIPFQIMAIRSWKQGAKTQKNEVFSPKFLSTSMMLLTLLVFVVIIAIDYLFATFVMYKDALGDNVIAKIISGAMIAASVLANYWLIYKKNDSWIYWLVYSVAGMLLAVVVYPNIFNFILFTFFLVINGIATIAWIKGTSNENYGWLKK